MGMLISCAPLALIVLAVVFRKRWLVWGGLALVLAFPLTLGGVSFYDWWTKGRFAKLENRVDWDEFEPFAPTNRLAAATPDAAFLFATNEPIPSVKCACALETVDVKTGARTVVKSFSRKVEAPNWTRDGRYLVYNSGGRLWRVPAAGGEEEPVDTGFCTRCNNDHVLSFDGRYVAVSHDEKGWGQSQVYVIPLDGSAAPRLVTPNTRCYLHGWSPDGKTFAYCAMRDADPKGDVYSIPSSGGEERRLTDAPGLDDGPEYSPDGRHIWFCSVRSGLMQIWRMNADGTGQTQMTDEKERNCWFPHVSPDGRLVAYIAYRKGDLEPGEHLAGKHVELRIMPAEGGEALTVARLYGGQGTINVNSWSPDSGNIAFVSYAEPDDEAPSDPDR